MSKHTPGPWEQDEDYVYAKSLGCYVAIVRTDDMTCGRYVSSNDAQEMIDANARLIASSPKLLNALERIASGVENGQSLSGTDCAEIAQEAIEGLTGG